MRPDYSKAAEKAQETAAMCFETKPLQILEKRKNVRVFPFDINAIPGDDSWDACTLVREKNGILQYIVMFNKNLPTFLLDKALARELGHIVLKHDGNGPEDVWMEEANCFAYHFLCPRPVVNVTTTIFFRPFRHTISASFKDVQTFDSIESLKQAVAEERTKINKFIGNSTVYSSKDVEIVSTSEENFAGWKNYHSVVLDGKAIGYCGE